jgi:hypothetical protein
MLKQLPLVVFLFFTALPLAAAGIFVFAALRARRQVSALKATPTSNIGMASDGYCQFEGRSEAIGGRPLTAPLTGSPCVWYYAKVERFVRQTRQDSGHWSTVKEATSSAPFLLRDSTGVCTVQPWQAEVTPSDKSQWHGSTLVPTDRNPPRLTPLESRSVVIEANQQYRYFEERLYADVPLVVAGEFTQGRFDTASAHDDDEDDDIDLDEGADEASGDNASTGDDPWSDDVISDELSAQARETTRARVWRGTSKKPFIITTQLQAVHVAMSDMGSQVALMMAAAFAALAALMLWARFA